MDNKIVVGAYVESVHVRYDPQGYDELDFAKAVSNVVDELLAHGSSDVKSFRSVNDNGHAIDLVFADELPLRDAGIWTNRINQMIKAEMPRVASRRHLATRLG
ncbi:MAG: hypothetical protein V4678_00125 [Patescibacteria group bacterium]